MITGAHAMIFTQGRGGRPRLPARRARIPCIDSGGGWLIFKLPPAELGVHGGENGFHQIYFICDDVDAFVATLAAKASTCGEPIAQEAWGRITGVPLPGGGKLGIYEAPARPALSGEPWTRTLSRKVRVPIFLAWLAGCTAAPPEASLHALRLLSPRQDRRGFRAARNQPGPRCLRLSGRPRRAGAGSG